MLLACFDPAEAAAAAARRTAAAAVEAAKAVEATNAAVAAFRFTGFSSGTAAQSLGHDAWSTAQTCQGTPSRATEVLTSGGAGGRRDLYQSISAMAEYAQHSFEELQLGDHQARRTAAVEATKAAAAVEAEATKATAAKAAFRFTGFGVPAEAAVAPPPWSRSSSRAPS
eukprot:SAG11_NODE_15407_length_579_cov_1.210417_1_plen_169_part_00